MRNVGHRSVNLLVLAVEALVAVELLFGLVPTALRSESLEGLFGRSAGTNFLTGGRGGNSIDLTFGFPQDLFNTQYLSKRRGRNISPREICVKNRAGVVDRRVI